MLCSSLAQQRDPQWTNGVGAVPHRLGHGSGEQLRRHRGALRRARQRLPGHQPAAPHPEETGRVRGAGPEGRPQVCMKHEFNAIKPKNKTTFDT